MKMPGGHSHLTSECLSLSLDSSPIQLFDNTCHGSSSSQDASSSQVTATHVGDPDGVPSSYL